MGRELYLAEPVYREQVDACADLLAEPLTLPAEELLALDLGVTAGVLGALGVQIQLQKLGAQALDLLLDRRADVVGAASKDNTGMATNSGPPTVHVPNRFLLIGAGPDPCHC